MVLSNFVSRQDEVTMVSFNVDISHLGFLYSTSITDYVYLFEQFKQELIELNDCQRNNVSFLLTERQLCIDFEYREYGHILCRIQANHFEMNDMMLHSSLNIEFELDQSFLPMLIDEIENAFTH